MHDLMNLKKMLCEELENYGKSRELSPSSLEMIDTLAHACKNVCKIIEAEEGGEYSMRGGSYRGGSYYDGNSRYSMDGYYPEDGMSHRRGRAANGRFVSRDGSEMAHRLREMMEDAPDDRTRQEIQRLADKMEQM
jgi:hypothetical protein